MRKASGNTHQHPHTDSRASLPAANTATVAQTPVAGRSPATSLLNTTAVATTAKPAVVALGNVTHDNAAAAFRALATLTNNLRSKAGSYGMLCELPLQPQVAPARLALVLVTTTAHSLAHVAKPTVVAVATRVLSVFVRPRLTQTEVSFPAWRVLS